MTFQCAVCGETHDTLPDIGVDRPDHWWDIPAEQRGRRAALTADTCIIDGEHYFIRGVIEIPVHGQRERFGIGVWVSQRRENFETYRAHWDSSAIGPFFGWLCTQIRFYATSTQLLKTMAHFRGDGQRPLIEVEPGEHPLAQDQAHGISLERAWSIVHFYQGPPAQR